MNLDSMPPRNEIDLTGHNPPITSDAKCQDSLVCVIEPHTKSIVQKKRSKTTRCNHSDCRKKLSLVDISMGQCKCSKIFCQNHRHNTTHKCSYDWHTNTKYALVKQLMRDKCVSAKAEKI